MSNIAIGTADADNLASLRADRVVLLQEEWTHRLHADPSPIVTEIPWSHVEMNHRMNFSVWHEEDIARRDDLGAERVRDAKRVIDRSNQMRNDAMEAIDQWIATLLPPASPTAPLHSETPGMMIDRLSILALKEYHMREEAEREGAEEAHRHKCAARLQVIRVQLNDLRSCLDTLLIQLAHGERAFRIYRQFKMYNDPALNPQLYRHGSNG